MTLWRTKVVDRKAVLLLCDGIFVFYFILLYNTPQAYELRLLLRYCVLHFLFFGQVVTG